MKSKEMKSQEPTANKLEIGVRVRVLESCRSVHRNKLGNIAKIDNGDITVLLDDGASPWFREHELQAHSIKLSR